MSSTPDLGPVLVSVPARTDYLHLLRLNVAGFAASAVDVDAVEDLKIAIEELAARLIQLDGDDALQITLGLEPAGLVVHGRRQVADGGELVPDEFLPMILDAVVDEYELAITDGTATFRFVKRLP